jgi:hypothetical protein
MSTKLEFINETPVENSYSGSYFGLAAVSVVAVPEPTTILLFLMGRTAMAVAVLKRRKRVSKILCEIEVHSEGSGLARRDRRDPVIILMHWVIF